MCDVKPCQIFICGFLRNIKMGCCCFSSGLSYLFTTHSVHRANACIIACQEIIICVFSAHLLVSDITDTKTFMLSVHHSVSYTTHKPVHMHGMCTDTSSMSFVHVCSGFLVVCHCFQFVVCVWREGTGGFGWRKWFVWCLYWSSLGKASQKTFIIPHREIQT